ncbi:hypothetical protein ALC56_02863, partial [Trachymyrmex septentrionalis]
NVDYIEPRRFLEDVCNVVLERVRDAVERHGAKVNTAFDGEFSKDKRANKSIITKNSEIYRCTDMREWYDRHVVEPTLASIEEFQERDRGHCRKQQKLRRSSLFTLTNLLRAGCRIKVPAMISVRTTNNACFAWSVVAALYSAEKYMERESSFLHYMTVLNLINIVFPRSMYTALKMNRSFAPDDTRVRDRCNLIGRYESKLIKSINKVKLHNITSFGYRIEPSSDINLSKKKKKKIAVFIYLPILLGLWKDTLMSFLLKRLNFFRVKRNKWYRKLRSRFVRTDIVSQIFLERNRGTNVIYVSVIKHNIQIQRHQGHRKPTFSGRFLNFNSNHMLMDVLANKKVPGLMKDENNDVLITEFIGLRAKMYAVRLYDTKGTKKAKRVKNNVVARTITFDDYTRCLNEEIEMTRRQSCINFLYIEEKLTKNKVVQSTNVALGNNCVAFIFDEIRYELNSVEIDRNKNIGITSTLNNYTTVSSDNVILRNVSWNAQITAAGHFNFCVPLYVLLGFCEDYKRVVKLINVILYLNSECYPYDDLNLDIEKFKSENGFNSGQSGFQLKIHSGGSLSDEIIKLQSLIHNQLSSPRYHNLFKYSWFKSDYCKKSLCLKYFFIEYHYYNEYNE